MSWLASFATGVTVFIGSLFGFSPQAPVTPPALQSQQTSETVLNSVSATSASAVTPQVSPPTSSGYVASGRSSSDGIPADAQALMQKIGCSDAQSCLSICLQQGMSQDCAQLRQLMYEQMSNGRSSNESGYSAGTGNSQPTGPEGNGTMNKSPTFASVGNNTPANAGSLPACPTSNSLFHTSPIALNDLAGIEPLGHLNAEHILPNQADHVYLDTKSSGETDVYAPGNATLLAVSKTVGTAGEDTGSQTTTVYFSPCSSVMFALQMSTLSPEIESALAHVTPQVHAGATVTSSMYGNLSISLTSGEKLGTIVGMQGRGGEVDFAATDVRTTPLAFIDQTETTGMLADSYYHAVCPINYFDTSLRPTLTSLLTMKHAGDNGLPACGSVMQDKAGTAQGNWYDKSLPTPAYQGINESALLAIVHSNLDASKGVVSVGTALIPNPRLGTQLVFTPTHEGYVNREPSEITPDGHVYCFDDSVDGTSQHVDIQLTSATELQADTGSGACAQSPVLSANTVTYER